MLASVAKEALLQGDQGHGEELTRVGEGRVLLLPPDINRINALTGTETSLPQSEKDRERLLARKAKLFV